MQGKFIAALKLKPFAARHQWMREHRNSSDNAARMLDDMQHMLLVVESL